MKIGTRVHGERGMTLIEIIVAAAVFALLLVIVDALFLGANRSSRKAELAADVQQNARIAIERLTREIRESSSSEIAIGGVEGARSVVFKSARLPGDLSVFCLYVRHRTDPAYTYSPGCFTGELTGPPYDSPPPWPLGTYTPIWQRWIGYYLTAVDGEGFALRRTTGMLTTPSSPLPDPTTLSGGDVIATFVETFDIAVSDGSVSVTLKARATEVVEGSALPPQEVRLPGGVSVRN